MYSALRMVHHIQNNIVDTRGMEYVVRSIYGVDIV